MPNIYLRTYVMCKVWFGTIRRLSCTSLGSELCMTMVGLAVQSLDWTQRNVISIGYQPILGLLENECNSWIVTIRKCTKCELKRVVLKQTRKWRVESHPLKKVPALIASIVLENIDRILSTPIAGMVPGKKHFTSSCQFLLGTLLLTLLVERKVFYPAQNASQWSIV